MLKEYVTNEDYIINIENIMKSSIYQMWNGWYSQQLNIDEKITSIRCNEEPIIDNNVEYQCARISYIAILTDKQNQQIAIEIPLTPQKDIYNESDELNTQTVYAVNVTTSSYLYIKILSISNVKNNSDASKNMVILILMIVC